MCIRNVFTVVNDFVPKFLARFSWVYFQYYKKYDKLQIKKNINTYVYRFKPLHMLAVNY